MSLLLKEKPLLLSGRAALRELWRKGLKGRELLQEHTFLIDSFLKDRFYACKEAKQGGIALVALGGYGRRELFPFSDIDLLILYADAAEELVSAVAESILYPLWDSGLEVGHGVRTIKACREDAIKDFFFQVALLDTRLICGDEEIYWQLRKSVDEDFVSGRRKDFVEKMIVHRKERHHRFGDHAYLLEPNIKDSRGGLRDMQAILWTSKVLFGLSDLSALVEAGLMTEDEAAQCRKAWDNLIQIRNRLHYVSGRKNDRLYFEYQEEISKAFGHYDGEGILGVEYFMRQVHEDLHTITVASDLFFEHVEEIIHPDVCVKKDEFLEPGIDVIGCHIHLTDQDLLKRKPHLLMRLFYHSAKTGLIIHHRTKRLISSQLDLIDKKMIRSKRMAKTFVETVSTAKDPLNVLEAMLDSGFLTVYIPEFGHVKSLAQHDVYHVNTVDRHLLKTVAEIKKLEVEEKDLFRTLASPHILYLAALFHDIGKGYGGGHSLHGARIVQEIGKRLHLSEEELACLSFLVKNHLFLVDTAMRRDLEDEALILRCAREVQDPDRLTMLYLLTIADSRATGPNVWNDWKAALVQELFLKIAHLLERSDLIDPNRIHAVEWMREQVAEKLGPDSDEDISILPEDYLLSFTPDAILKHLELKKGLSKHPIIFLPSDKTNYWSIMIMAKDRTGLLSRIFGVMALHNLNILAAQIFTLKDGTAVDVLDVKSAFGEKYEEKDWDAVEKDLVNAIQDRLGLAHRLAQKYVRQSLGSPYMCTHPRPDVVIDNTTSDFYTIIEVHARNRMGMLYDITRTLADFSINIFRAKIGSDVDREVDVFYVQDRYGQKIEDQALQNELKDALVYAAGCTAA